MKITIKLLLMLLCLPIFYSYAQPIDKNKLSKISIGMTKEQVISCLGEPYLNRGAYKQRNGTLWECFEYQVQVFEHIRTFFLYFDHGKLTQYCQPGDFKGAA